MSDEYIKREDAEKLFDEYRTMMAIKTCEYGIELKKIPSADAVSVVRCKDCRFSEVFQNDSSGVMARYCNAFRLVRMVADDDYCSYGERKDNE